MAKGEAVDDSLFHPETFKRAAGYKVVAPMVNMKTATPQGYRLLAFHAGAPVPPDVDDETVFYHLRDHMIEEVGAPAPPPLDAEPPVAPTPPGDQGQAPDAGPAKAEPDAEPAKAAPAARSGARTAK